MHERVLMQTWKRLNETRAQTHTNRFDCQLLQHAEQTLQENADQCEQ